jgi:Replicase family/Primase C terminal 1 (PriCT-1)
MELNAEKIRFKEHLIQFPHCSDDIENGIFRKQQENAVLKKYISLNKTFKSYLAFDIDRKNSVYDWYDLNCPQPTIITRNPKSDHCQYLYELETPVIYTSLARKHPQRYFEAIHRGLNSKLQGDLGFTGYMVRNPLAVTTPVTLDRKYQLQELEEYLDLDYKTKLYVNSLGRNCTIFDSLRLEAYKLSKRDPTLEELFNELQYLGNVLNQDFEIPLPQKEVRTICKSISTWVDRHYVGSGLRRGVMKLPKVFSLKSKQKLAGKFSAKSNNDNVSNIIIDAVIEHLQKSPNHLTAKIIAEKTGLHKTTVSKCFSEFY